MPEPEEPDAASPAKEAELAICRRLRLLRRARGRSLQAVAAETGLSIGLISQIERGLSSPSVKNLISLGKALGVDLPWFFNEEPALAAAESRLVMRQDQRRLLAMEGGVRKELLSPDPERPIQVFVLTVEPGGSTGPGAYSHKGDVGALVVSGQLLLWIEDEQFVLNEGDSFAIPRDKMRRFANPNPHHPTRLFWAIAYLPDPGTDPEAARRGRAAATGP